ncbi:MAG TPA: alpha/beta hydrolase [Rudaea sp.]|jgi:acetyl esterase/lipase
MIESARRLGNRFALTVALLALSGCADAFFAAVDRLEYSRNVTEHDHIVFDAAHDLALDAYAPAGASGDPVVVFFYGGSWSEGKRHWYRYVGDALADKGVVVLIPDYRKYPDVHFPSFMHDAARAVAWARQHASEFGGDPRHIFVMGHSAGGQIAALLACDKRYLADVGMKPRDLAGMIGVAGAYAFLPFVEDEPEIFGDDAKGRYDSQPINFVDGDEPPMLLLQGTNDDEVPPNNAEAMAERAQAMDGTATLKLYPDVGHNEIMLALARGRHASVPTLADTLAFIARIDAAGKAASMR